MNQHDTDGNTLLICAIKRGYHQCADVIIKTGVSVNTRGQDGETPLYVAANNFVMVKSLLKAGASVKYCLPNGDMPILKAAREGWLDSVKAMLRAGPNVDIFNDESCLVKAMRTGNAAVIHMLIEAGANVNRSSRFGETPLLMAVIAGQENMVDLLLNKGAFLNKKDKGGFTPLMKAISQGHPGCIDILLNAGADVNIDNKTGVTALMIAVQKNTLKYVKILLELGADVNAISKKGETALASAINNTKCFNMLKDAGADVNILNQNGHPALLLAINYAPTVVSSLVQAGADVNLATHRGNTALMLAARKNNFAQVREFLLAGAHVNIKNLYGNNTIQTCLLCDKPDPRIIMLLYVAGETLDGASVETCKRFINGDNAAISRHLKRMADLFRRIGYMGRKSINLMVMCRVAIRNQLRKVEPHSSFFWRIPHLGLPVPLTRYMLHNVRIIGVEINHPRKINLMAMSRVAIRNQLRLSDPQLSLFLKIQHLEIPAELIEYLLYR